jgi:hypothetical protein
MTLDAPDSASLAASYRTQADELERVARQTAAALREEPRAWRHATRPADPP